MTFSQNAPGGHLPAEGFRGEVRVGEVWGEVKLGGCFRVCLG
ncbi:hypothetical protein VB620_11510 [Nodularia harveyana UHCC-0300]|uniref:Uncharacterized protein n=1 Tax=Nodularia harveyana UHCC-0300 TaxID=2974287 RepID=A0ABU5UEL5_9CYAN|nr:hypothetical protein [Nodularia harveyana]MEA5581966.1 hypothetical protein [Nodularia harveyana UHCC-0300]